MAMTEEERFRFDLTGFLVRPAILEPVEVAAIVDQIDRIKHDPKSLPPEHRDVPGQRADRPSPSGRCNPGSDWS